jgi:hypothetical protein
MADHGRDGSDLLAHLRICQSREDARASQNIPCEGEQDAPEHRRAEPQFAPCNQNEQLGRAATICEMPPSPIM